MSELTAAQEAAQDADALFHVNAKNQENGQVANVGYYWAVQSEGQVGPLAVAAELRADRLARQEQHDELMVMLGAVVACCGPNADPGMNPVELKVYDRAIAAVSGE